MKLAHLADLCFCTTPGELRPTCICLTPGQAATNRGDARSDEELAAIRRAEFAASCKILQVTEAQVLDYPDGGLSRVDFYAVVGDLTRRVRR